tara:strand:- start:264 stop:575 length:312 start_codon:yes stop_codon:yes gene_type:complete
MIPKDKMHSPEMKLRICKVIFSKIEGMIKGGMVHAAVMLKAVIKSTIALTPLDRLDLLNSRKSARGDITIDIDSRMSARGGPTRIVAQMNGFPTTINRWRMID